jgi:calcium/calmodulin-dependent protein kinase I
MSLAFPKQNPGRIEDTYEFGGELGSGAFSVVKEGKRKKDGESVAIKIVAKENTNAREMFCELEVQSKLNHENVVRFFELFDEPDGFYVVMELITGGELFDRIIELRRYTEKDASHVTRQALLGIKHMHDANLVHRDLKPENLLLSSKAADATVKVADFGFSTECGLDEELFETLGTPPYMAPELVILRNDDDSLPGYGKPVDVWALGICLYILLSGIHPFQIEDEDQMLDNIEDGIWRWLGPNWDSISTEGKELIKHMMDADPKTRWTIDQCLESKWIKGHAHEIELDTVKDEIRAFQAKKRLKGAIFGVMASNKMKTMMASLSASKKAAAASAGPTITAPPAAEAAPRKRIIKTERKVTQRAMNVDFECLRIVVESGKDLAPKDANGKSDPYLRVFCGPYKYKTKVVKKTLDPVWSNEIFEIPANFAKVNPIEIECWDWDVIGTDDFMGEFSFKADVVGIGETTTKAFTLEKPKQKSKKKAGDVSGTITLRVTKDPLRS